MALKRVVGLALALLLVGGVVAPRAGSAPGTLRAGVGTADITPPVGTPMFAYTAREAVVGGLVPFLTQETFDTNFYAKTFVASVGVHTRLRSRALVLEDGGQRIALVAVDLGGLPHELHEAVARRLEAAGAGIARERLLLSATHTHAGAGPLWPPTHSGYAILGGDVFDPRVFTAVADRIARSVLDAVASLEPARVGTASVEVLDATNNRSLGPHLLNGDEAHDTRADDKPHAIDGTLTVVRADTAAGRPLGLWTTFAIHGTAFGDGMLHFTGDNHAYAERIVEEEIRRRAGLGPDDVVVHALANGAEGDISPRTSPPVVGEVPGALPPEDGGEPAAWVRGPFAGAEVAGRRVARGALAAWEAAGAAMVDSLVLDTRTTNLPLDGSIVVAGEPVGLTAVLGCAGVVCPDGTELPVDLPGQGAKLPLAAGLPGILAPAFAPLQVLRIGDLLLAAAPFEITKQMGTRIEAAVAAAASTGGFTAGHVALVGLANGYLSYMTTPEEYDASRYEASFTLYGRQQGPAVQAGLARLAGALARGADVPAGATPLPFVDVHVDLPPLLPEPEVGRVLEQPVDTARFATATFRWVGGDPAADDPHIRIERLGRDSRWEAVATDDGYEDLVTHRRPLGTLRNEWSERWETSVCTGAGTHRFVVRGRSAAGPYELTSQPFEVLPAASPTPEPVDATGGVARFRATYPEPPDDTMRVRPRFASGGHAEVEVTGADRSSTRVPAPWSDADQAYVAPVPAGASATAVEGSVVDGCGNGAVTAAAGAPATPAGPAGPAATLGHGAPPSGAVPALPATGSDVPAPAALAAAVALAALAVRRRPVGAR